MSQYGFVYLMQSQDRYKIGSSDHPERRRREVESLSGLPVTVLHVIRSEPPIDNGFRIAYNSCMAERRLTPKQEAFVAEYLVDLNATAAARRAGYQGRNLDKVGSELLGKTGVAAAIAAGQAERAARVELTADWILERLKIEAELTGEDASHSARVAALKLIGLHLGMFPRRHEHTGKGGGPIESKVSHDVSAVRERLAPYADVLAGLASDSGAVRQDDPVQ